MKKLLSTVLVLGSTAMVAACAGNGTSEADLDGTLTSGPYAEERTVGSSDGAANVMTKTHGHHGHAHKSGDSMRKVVRSAEPVFQNRQVK